MAATGRGTTDALKAPRPPAVVLPVEPAPVVPPWPRQSVAARLYREPFAFDFFQSVRILEKLASDRFPVGRNHPPLAEVVRFRAQMSLNFPPSTIYDLQPATVEMPVPTLIVSFFGLTGPSGVLPRHYTELLLRTERDIRGAERYLLRDWLDLFNHRLISLFYRSWEKYRFYIPYERGEGRGNEQDLFTRSLMSLIGLGEAPLRNRLRVSVRDSGAHALKERPLARVEDLALIYYSGYLAHRPRCAAGLEAMLHDYFQLPVEVRQFQGEWLHLEPSNQSRLGDPNGNSILGVNLVAGERVWDVQGKIRIRVGPLNYEQFEAFLPDRAPVPERKRFFELVHLARLYAGPELAFDVQLLLAPEAVPECQLAESTADGPQLGWNAWIRSQCLAQPAADAVFEGEEVVWLN